MPEVNSEKASNGMSQESAWSRLMGRKITRRGLGKAVFVVGAGVALAPKNDAFAAQIPEDPSSPTEGNDQVRLMDVPLQVLDVMVDTDTEGVRSLKQEALRMAYPNAVDRKVETTLEVAGFQITNANNVGEQKTFAIVQTAGGTKVYFQEGEKVIQLSCGLLDDRELVFTKKSEEHKPGSSEVMKVHVFSKQEQESQLSLTGQAEVRFADGSMHKFEFPDDHRHMLDRAVVQIKNSMALGDKTN